MPNPAEHPQNGTSPAGDFESAAVDSDANSEFDVLEADEQELAGLEEALGGINQLTELGNRATALGLIIGHGYHGGQYEILRKGEVKTEVMTLEPQAAVAFLRQLMAQGSSHSPESTPDCPQDQTQDAAQPSNQASNQTSNPASNQGAEG